MARAKKDNQKYDIYEKLISYYINSDSQFIDSYQTREQKARDCEVTKLLKQYVTAYTNKVEAQKIYRKVLLALFSVIIGIFSLTFCFLLLFFGIIPQSTDLAGVVSLISVCVTFLISILGLAQIMVKYCFPENDEEYITNIVGTIQKNDLSHKLANMNTSAENVSSIPATGEAPQKNVY